MPPFRPDRAFFLDLDGTLFEIRSTPQAVRRQPEEVELVSRLVEAAGGAVAVVSGRPLAGIDRLFAPLKLSAAGQHGAERRSAGGALHRAPLPTETLRKAAEIIATFAARHEGLVFEDKGLSLALHYRLAPEREVEARAVLDQAAAMFEGEMQVQGGKMVFELRPAACDKGTAIEAFMREPPFAGRTPLFIGDDETDEHGFHVVNRMGGDSVKVGEGESAARWRIGAPAAVRAWLARGLGHAPGR